MVLGERCLIVLKHLGLGLVAVSDSVVAVVPLGPAAMQGLSITFPFCRRSNSPGKTNPPHLAGPFQFRWRGGSMQPPGKWV